MDDMIMVRRFYYLFEALEFVEQLDRLNRYWEIRRIESIDEKTVEVWWR